jgi:hypothetical protein
MPQSRCLDPMGEACSLQRPRGLSVLRRPAHRRWQHQPSSCQLGHMSETIAARQASESCLQRVPAPAAWHESLPFHGRRAWPADGTISVARARPTWNSKCLKSPRASVVPLGGQAGRCRRLRRRVPVIPLLSRVRLTPPSRGRPQAGFAHLRPPLTSNVRAQHAVPSQSR